MTLRVRGPVADGLAGGAVAAVVAGAPSTLHALATGASPLEATLAAGSIALPGESRRLALLLAAVPVHSALSLGWGALLGVALPRRRTIVAGAVAGLLIAALDLGVVGRRYPRIRALPSAPQVADHLAYGLTVAGVVQRRRRERPGTPLQDSRPGVDASRGAMFS